MGLNPRIAVERLDSGEARIGKIIELIQDSKYAIHDLSRIKAQKRGEYFRLNMPLELGIDIGCKLFGTGRKSKKMCLVLVAENYKYQAAISDLSNSDVGVHKNSPYETVVVVRNWLNNSCGLMADGPAKIWDTFNEFMADNYAELSSRGFSKKDIENLEIIELMNSMMGWVKARGP